jgi:exosortase
LCLTTKRTWQRKARKLLGVGYAMLEMKGRVAPENLVQSTGAKILLRQIAPAAIFFGLLWLAEINHMRPEWSLNPEYGYGWSVPFLALYLIWRRWTTCPSPSPAESRVLPIALMLFGSFLFFPIRFVAEANPDWRLLSWSFATVAVTVSLSWVYLAGGRPWLRHFAFPLVFFLVAVPWPTHLEQFVVQNLMRAVAAVNVFFLNVAGVPALQHGNVVEVGSGLIGIEEACSGVRSFQATLMISLFLGELYSFKVARRVFLVVAGGVLAFFCNIVRTAILVWVGAKNGSKSIEAWHDPAGLTILLVCLFGLWGISLLMRSRDGAQMEPAIGASQKRLSLRFTGPLLVGFALWLVVAESAVQLWYRAHRASILSSRWTVSWPTSANGYKQVPVAPDSRALLRYDQGGGASWEGPHGHRWMMYFFRWFPGQTAALFVKIHRPDICLPASGLKMIADHGIHLLTINGVKLPVRSYRFDDHGTPLHVFYCYWDARSSYKSEKAANEEDWTPQGRLRAALRGRREMGAQMFEVVVWDYDNDAEVNAALRKELKQIVRAG